LNLGRRSLADRDSLGVSLRGLCAAGSSDQQAPGRHAWPPLILFLLLLFVPWVGDGAEYKAQQAGKVWRIGVLSPEVPPPGLLEEFQEGLRELGYVEGKNLAFELRYARGRNDRLP
jgi:hypothetical protein